MTHMSNTLYKCDTQYDIIVFLSPLSPDCLPICLPYMCKHVILRINTGDSVRIIQVHTHAIHRDHKYQQ